jgi:protein-S-isoprenylcysteine O-methyltransferase Ste14
MSWRIISRAKRGQQSAGSSSGAGPVDVRAEFTPHRGDQLNWFVKNTRHISSCLGILVIANLCISVFSSHVLQRRQIIALLLFALADGMLHRAEVALGKFFTPRMGIYNDHQLITTGPYRYICHPGYMGFLGCFFAMTIFSWDNQCTLCCNISTIPNMAAVLMPVLAAVFFLACRIPEEEVMLAKKFGAAWLAYKRGKLDGTLHPS